MHPLFLPLALLLATTLVYLPGLGGPFVFDDPPNIILPLTAWLDGQTGWRDIVFGNGSGMLGRPISMLTFLINAAISGLAPLPFKATNLAIHLACGALLYVLLVRLLARDPQLHRNGRIAALAVCALWLLHPMQVSTVLYIVQRMAQLSTLFTLLALLAYVHARCCLVEQGHHRTGLLCLFMLLPLVTMAAMLSKENGALVPLFCLVIELAYFPSSETSPRPRAISLFFSLSLALPCLVALIWITMHPHWLANSYIGRLFTLRERLLSEPRALMDYMAALLLPRGPSLGLYTDDFIVSRSLMDPSSTLPAIALLITLIAAALSLRKFVPSFFAGVFFYLAGHALESTALPLELYFEHRNYLPSVGFFLAVVGIAAWLANRLLTHAQHQVRISRWLNFGAAALMIMLGLATMARAGVWDSLPSIAEQGAREHPNSMRAQLDYANMLQVQGRIDEAQQVFDHLATIDNPAARHVAAIDSATLQCMAHDATTQTVTDRIANIAGAPIQLAELLAFENLGKFLQKNECRNLSKIQLADIIVSIVDASTQPPTLIQLWRNRFVAAQLYLSAGELSKAQEQAALAWMTGAADASVGIYLANLYYLANDRASARLILADAIKHIKSWDQRDWHLVAEIKQRFESEASKSNVPAAAR